MGGCCLSLGERWRVGWVAAEVREGSRWTGKMLRLNSPQALGASRGWMDKVHR